MQQRTAVANCNYDLSAVSGTGPLSLSLILWVDLNKAIGGSS